ncbi:hypothetical protein [Pseudomonas frederiksbergensis]|uniref:hypothetical protein n=1 Tax=Pseudomonas frederiksbergensis TaxID=104087 RepID=UPI001374812D|nr:hypothetical protein [Pseudomonas frederiksbergensis]
MLESSRVPKAQDIVVSPDSQSDQELKLLAMFRQISEQHQNDILRLLEALAQLSE